MLVITETVAEDYYRNNMQQDYSVVEPNYEAEAVPALPVFVPDTSARPGASPENASAGLTDF